MFSTAKKGIWFGKLADGTEASICDVIMQELTVVQAARVRLQGRASPLSLEQSRVAAQQLRQRFPELNREEQLSLYAEARFSRNTLPEEVAAKAVSVCVAEASTDPEACQAEALAVIQDHVMRHPSSFSRLGWQIDILFSPDDNDCVVWFLFSVSHTHADGVAMHTIVNHYLESYLELLQESPTLKKPKEILPLYSALPRDRLPLSWSQKASNGFIGWLVSKLIGKPGSPALKLLTESMAKHALEVQLDREQNGKDQHEGPMHVDFVELDAASTQQLCVHAQSVGLTVGALVHSALFLAISKRYFQEHPDKDNLSLEIPMSVNMRPFLQPPLSNTVLAPQQGDVMVRLQTSRLDLDRALANGAKAMIPLVHKIAVDSRSQLQKALDKPEKLSAVNNNILLASLVRHGLDKMGPIQYIGDAWLSNVGLFRPSDTINEANGNGILKVETTFTVSSTIVPAYEVLWCNSVAGGSMALSMVTDETMGRDQASAKSLLTETATVLKTLLY